MNNLAPWLALSHLHTVKPIKLKSWLDQGRSCESLFQSSTEDLSGAGFNSADISKIKAIDWLAVEEEERYCENEASVITLQDPLYPPLLKEINDPPLVLYISGDARLLCASQLAMVGSRKPSPAGGLIAQNFAKALVEQGLVVTSGLAAGIDSFSHQGAIDAGGKTIAVMGTGLNHIYPRSNRRLAEKIRENGALVSEFPLNTGPVAWHFPRRNRLISGLSLGVLVVEAASRSGSLITARLALEQNREVFAIPGSIHQPLARGCHQLIRQGAKLVESVTDIVEELDSLLTFRASKTLSSAPASILGNLEAEQEALLKQVNFSVTAFDSIRERSGLTAREVSSMLLLLELRGYIESVQGGYIRCI